MIRPATSCCGSTVGIDVSVGSKRLRIMTVLNLDLMYVLRQYIYRSRKTSGVSIRRHTVSTEVNGGNAG